jgi:site-specific recombinase XerD
MNTSNATHSIASFVQRFFNNYLAAQRGLSKNTIISYSDCLKLYFLFVSEQIRKHVDNLSVEDFDEPLSINFLNDLEETRGNSIQTRNNRLMALRTFFRYVASQEPILMARCHQICAIPLKRTKHIKIEYLDDQETSTLLKSVDQTSRNGLRDYALLIFSYNTGGRVQEVADVKIDDLRLEIPFQVKLTGKGGKERVCLLWPETVDAIENYIQSRGVDASKEPTLFLNANGYPLTRFGIRYIVRKYGAIAAKKCPSMKSKRVNPHTLRHTTAVHLLQSGNDISVVKDWLGHADVNTTHGYVEIDIKMKLKALELCRPPKVKTAKRRPKWQNQGILQWLNELTKTSRNNV